MSYVLSANVDGLTLLGSADLKGTGNAIDNRIEGTVATTSFLARMGLT